jgi:hypothetical protein
MSAVGAKVDQHESKPSSTTEETTRTARRNSGDLQRFKEQMEKFHETKLKLELLQHRKEVDNQRRQLKELGWCDDEIAAVSDDFDDGFGRDLGGS